jgi:heat shock protein HslJ
MRAVLELRRVQGVSGSAHVENMYSTAMGCPPLEEDQDQWIAGLLQSSPSIADDGTRVVVSGARGELTLVDAAVVHPGRPLVDTVWRVDGFFGGGGALDDRGSFGTALVIASEGRLTLDTRRGRTSALVTFASSSLIVGDPSTSAATCTADEEEAEEQILAVLTGELTYAIHENSPRLTSSNGNGLSLIGTTPDQTSG